MRISIFKVCPREEVGTGHFQAISARLVTPEHQSRRLNRLLDYRDLALVELEVDDLRWFGFCLSAPFRPHA
jgi:hypothetical protein